MKRDFLVCYDYGQGGVWALIAARSAAEIEQKFPELAVVTRTPDWMTSEDRKRLDEEMRFDIDKPEGWLASFLAQRQAPRS